jgi:hypothetical protein
MELEQANHADFIEKQRQAAAQIFTGTKPVNQEPAPADPVTQTRPETQPRKQQQFVSSGGKPQWEDITGGGEGGVVSGKTIGADGDAFGSVSFCATTFDDAPNGTGGKSGMPGMLGAPSCPGITGPRFSARFESSGCLAMLGLVG